MTESALKLVPQGLKLMREVVIVETQARELMVIDSVSYVAAGELWKAIKAIRVKIADTFDKSIKAAHELHKGLVAKKKEHDGPLDAAERMVKKAMGDYDAEQDRIRKAEEARLREIARKEEEERLLQEAIAAEASGNKEEAAAIMEEPVYVAPVVVKKEVPKVQGMSFRTIWKFRIVDEKKIPREYLTPDMVKIGGVVRSMKKQTNIPGIESYEERV